MPLNWSGHSFAGPDSPDLNPTIAELFVAGAIATYPLDRQLAVADLVVWDRVGSPPTLLLRHKPHGQYDRDVAKAALLWGRDVTKTLKAAGDFKTALKATLDALERDPAATFGALPELLQIAGLAGFTNTSSAALLEGKYGVREQFIAKLLSALTNAICKSAGCPVERGFCPFSEPHPRLKSRVHQSENGARGMDVEGHTVLLVQPLHLPPSSAPPPPHPMHPGLRRFARRGIRERVQFVV